MILILNCIKFCVLFHVIWSPFDILHDEKYFQKCFISQRGNTAELIFFISYSSYIAMVIGLLLVVIPTIHLQSMPGQVLQR